MVKLELNYSIKEKNWKIHIQKKDIQARVLKIINNIFLILNIKENNDLIIEISIIFTNDLDIKKINNEYRKIDKSTNVLSFPTYENEFFDVIKNENYIFLGDIILSLETMLKEIEEENITFNYHLNHLILHSILHLIGLDHQEDNEAEEMEKIEGEILSKMG